MSKDQVTIYTMQTLQAQMAGEAENFGLSYDEAVMEIPAIFKKCGTPGQGSPSLAHFTHESLLWRRETGTGMCYHKHSNYCSITSHSRKLTSSKYPRQ